MCYINLPLVLQLGDLSLTVSQMSGDRSVSAFPDGDNLFRWIGTINGPIGTVWIKSLTFTELL